MTCLFDDLLVEPGATSSNPLCQPGLTVPWDTECPFTKSNGETCTSAWCERNYGWVTLKIECSDKSCDHNDLEPPDAATMVDDSRCPQGGKVPHGAVCAWQKNKDMTSLFVLNNGNHRNIF